MSIDAVSTTRIPNPVERHFMALEEVQRRMERIVAALNGAGVPYALVGGQAVACWVSTLDPDAVRTTKDVDLLLRREDLPRARAAALAAEFDYFEVIGVGMFLDRTNPHPKRAVHILWSGEQARPEYPLPSPTVEERELLQPGVYVVPLAGLVRMKLMANRDHDRAHLRDMIDVGLIDRSLLTGLPSELADRLARLLTEQGRGD
jgi:hypothetical protein